MQWPDVPAWQPWNWLRKLVLFSILAIGSMVLLRLWLVQAESAPLSATMQMPGPAEPTPEPLIGYAQAHPRKPTAREEAEANHQAGLTALAQGNDALAKIWFEAALQADATYDEPYNNLALYWYERGDLHTAIELWFILLRLSPQSADANAGLATALWITGNRAEALIRYTQAIALEPKFADPAWLQTHRYWSEKILSDSQPLRNQISNSS